MKNSANAPISSGVAMRPAGERSSTLRQLHLRQAKGLFQDRDSTHVETETPPSDEDRSLPIKNRHMHCKGSCGANGTRTRNPLLAKQVRYQLRHSPVGETQSSTASVTDVHRSALSERSTRICRTAMPTATTDPTATQHVTHFFMMILRFRSPADGGPRWARTTDLSLIRTAL